MDVELDGCIDQPVMGLPRFLNAKYVRATRLECDASIEILCLFSSFAPWANAGK